MLCTVASGYRLLEAVAAGAEDWLEEVAEARVLPEPGNVEEAAGAELDPVGAEGGGMGLPCLVQHQYINDCTESGRRRLTDPAPHHLPGTLSAAHVLART